MAAAIPLHQTQVTTADGYRYVRRELDDHTRRCCGCNQTVTKKAKRAILLWDGNTDARLCETCTKRVSFIHPLLLPTSHSLRPLLLLLPLSSLLPHPPRPRSTAEEERELDADWGCATLSSPACGGSRMLETKRLYEPVSLLQPLP